MDVRGQGMGLFAVLVAAELVVILFAFIVLDKAITEDVYAAGLAGGLNNTTATTLMTWWSAVPWVFGLLCFVATAMYALQRG